MGMFGIGYNTMYLYLGLDNLFAYHLSAGFYDPTHRQTH